MVSVRKELYDEATQERRGRKKRNVPRLGGVSLFPILVISVGLPLAYTFMLGDSFDTNGETQAYFVQFMMMLAGLTTMYLVGVMDDLVGVSLHSKLIIEFLAAMLIPLSGLGINDLNGMFGVYELPSWIAFPLTVGAVMYITNTIPMLDDVDGLAAGMSIIAFSVLGSLCYQSEQYLLYHRLSAELCRDHPRPTGWYAAAEWCWYDLFRNPDDTDVRCDACGNHPPGERTEHLPGW